MADLPGPSVMQGVLGWPARGAIEVPYGSREEGVPVKGWVLRCDEGSEVMAAQDGKVVFMDERLPGYGKTIILEHGSGFSTVYARNAVLMVSAGQIVKKGQVIARSGKTGKGVSPQLYFEVRRSGRAQNPKDFLA